MFVFHYNMTKNQWCIRCKGFITINQYV